MLNKNFKKIVLIAIILVCVLLPVSVIQAFQVNNFYAGDDVYLPEGTVIDPPLFAAGGTLNISADVNDDIYIAGGDVTVSGKVDGDIIVAGGNIMIESDVTGNIRAAGGNIIIRGKVGKNVTIGSGMLTIEKTAEIGKNLIIGSGKVVVDGKVGKNIYGGVGNMVLNSEVMGDVFVKIDTDGGLTLNPETNIHGNLEYMAVDMAVKREGATIQKQENYIPFEFKAKKSHKSSFSGFSSIVALVSLLGSIIVGLVIVSIFKNFTIKLKEQVAKDILVSMLIGLVFIIIVPIILLILAITLIGLPLAALSLAVYLVILYISKIYVCLYIGERIIKLFNKDKEANIYWSMVLGLFCLYLVIIIFNLLSLMWLSMIIKFIICIWGIGILVMAFKKIIKK